jgi:hypothetical protein
MVEFSHPKFVVTARRFRGMSGTETNQNPALIQQNQHSVQLCTTVHSSTLWEEQLVSINILL